MAWGPWRAPGYGNPVGQVSRNLGSPAALETRLVLDLRDGERRIKDNKILKGASLQLN